MAPKLKQQQQQRLASRGQKSEEGCPCGAWGGLGSPAQDSVQRQRKDNEVPGDKSRHTAQTRSTTWRRAEGRHRIRGSQAATPMLCAWPYVGQGLPEYQQGSAGGQHKGDHPRIFRFPRRSTAGRYVGWGALPRNMGDGEHTRRHGGQGAASPTVSTVSTDLWPPRSGCVIASCSQRCCWPWPCSRRRKYPSQGPLRTQTPRPQHLHLEDMPEPPTSDPKLLGTNPTHATPISS